MAPILTSHFSSGALSVRKITYWRKTGKVSTEDFSSVELNQLPSK